MVIAVKQVVDPGPELRLEDVARLVGASRATLYYYFSGRDDLLSFLLTEHTRHGAEAVRAAVRADGGPEARLRAMLTALAEYLASHPGTCAGPLGAFGAAGRLDEVLQAIELGPPAPASAYLKVRERESYEFALVSAAAAVELADARIVSARIALGGVAIRPWPPCQARPEPVGVPAGSP